MEQKRTLQVVAALIWQQNRFLICQRPKNKARALLWEFVGGKVEKGETKQQALQRECQEELAILVEVGGEFCHLVHSYNDVNVDLTLFNATIVGGSLQMLEHNDLRWILPSEVGNFEFCPADKTVLDLIQSTFCQPNGE